MPNALYECQWYHEEGHVWQKYLICIRIQPFSLLFVAVPDLKQKVQSFCCINIDSRTKSSLQMKKKKRERKSHILCIFMPTCVFASVPL